MQRQKREYSKAELVFGNGAIFIWILLGTAACWLYFSFGAIVFLALASFLVFYELGKKGCLSCFLCKTCTIGMGKLPELFFTKTTVENMNRKALKLFPFVYLLISVVPLALVSVSLIQHLAIYNVLMLAALVGFSVLTGIIRRKLLVNR
ncbi:MAG: hypothetical protein ABSA79_08955 [Candidatus Bathyarchaeia archaeon]